MLPAERNLRLTIPHWAVKHSIDLIHFNQAGVSIRRRSRRREPIRAPGG